MWELDVDSQAQGNGTFSVVQGCEKQINKLLQETTAADQMVVKEG